MIDLEKAYDASKYEAEIYQKWLDSGYFNPDNLTSQGEPYTIVLPPPNVTGTLHVGHALGITIQDILIRFRRMQGRKALWVPGTDHAAIATQSKVEKLLEKEGKRKTDLGREEFLKRVADFAKDSHDTIISQMKAMGASLDWSREAYTLDEQRSRAVRTAFKAMYDDGLIYRGHRVVNWDPKGQTVISDDEVVHQERDAMLYTFKYSHDFPISISTTRPETKVGDTAVAVHPDDERYKEFVGKEYDVEFCGVQLSIKIVADESVEKEFGTGALGVTPAHSNIDAEIAQRHNLPMKQVINEHAKMTVGDKRIFDKKTAQAREAVVEWLRENNLLEKEEPIKQNIATAERTGGIIEPLPKLQWFLAVDKPFTIKRSEIAGIASGQTVTLKQLMRHVVETEQIRIIPDRYAKIYFHWIDNLRDWCISRQIWYGHRVPVWYKYDSNGTTDGTRDASDDTHVGIEAPEGYNWEQDEDTLDTWFSSGLWTFTTLGWPEETSNIKTFHPTDVLETGYDILFFWIARMVLMTTYHTGQIPFRTAFMHGLVRDAQNRKMSKSLGNIINPVDMIAKYGTDALRFALVFNTAPGTDMALAEDKIKGMKHFGNKLWNIARFVFNSIDAKTFQNSDAAAPKPITDADALILQQLEDTTTTVTKALEGFRIHDAAQSLYDFIWHQFADVYIESSKNQLQDEATHGSTQTILLHTLAQSLKLLHPFMPFVTEVLWRQLRSAGLTQDDLLLVAKWPQHKS